MYPDKNFKNSKKNLISYFLQNHVFPKKTDLKLSLKFTAMSRC